MFTQHFYEARTILDAIWGKEEIKFSVVKEIIIQWGKSHVCGQERQCNGVGGWSHTGNVKVHRAQGVQGKLEKSLGKGGGSFQMLSKGIYLREACRHC
jgi:hypothetical protein